MCLLLRCQFTWYTNSGTRWKVEKEVGFDIQLYCRSVSLRRIRTSNYVFVWKQHKSVTLKPNLNDDVILDRIELIILYEDPSTMSF